MRIDGRDAIKEKYSAIALRRGQSVIDSLSDGGQNLKIRVFDPTETSYADIIRKMEQSGNERIRLGIYHKDKDIIITQMEIYG